MSNRDGLCRDNRSQFEQLACEGLGYCCPYAFLRANKQTGQIAIRLGLDRRTVQRWKAKFREKEIVCEERKMLCLLPMLRKIGK